MQKEQFKNIFDFQKKSKIKAGDGYKLGEAQYPFYTSSNVLTKSIDEYLFEDESLIFGTGGLASIHFCSEKFAVSTDCFVTQPKDKKQVFSKFVYYYLSGNMNILESGFKGAGLKHISKDYLENIEIPLPPLATQQRIAAILDQADALIQNNRAIVQKYDALTQSLFLDMFGGLKDNIKSLAEVCDINPKKSEISSLDKDLKVSFLQMSNVSEKGELILNDNRSILNVWSGFTYFRENDVLFAKITPCMENGKGAIARLLTNGIGFGSTEFHVLRPITNLANSEWIYYLTMNKKFRALAEKNMTGSAGQKRVPKDFFSNYKLPIPTITLQNQFAERVAVIEAQKQQAQLALSKSEELFQSLLQQAFKGELS